MATVRCTLASWKLAFDRDESETMVQCERTSHRMSSLGRKRSKYFSMRGSRLGPQKLNARCRLRKPGAPLGHRTVTHPGINLAFGGECHETPRTEPSESSASGSSIRAATQTRRLPSKRGNILRVKPLTNASVGIVLAIADSFSTGKLQANTQHAVSKFSIASSTKGGSARPSSRDGTWRGWRS